MKLTKSQRQELIAMLNDADNEVKHGRWSNEKLVEKAQQLAEDGGKPSMGEILSRYRPHYVVSVTPQGRKSRSNGDAVAETLQGYEPVQIIAAAEKLLGLKKKELLEKYAGMNQGQARMNVGNRLRAAVKRGDITIDEVEKAINQA